MRSDIMLSSICNIGRPNGRTSKTDALSADDQRGECEDAVKYQAAAAVQNLDLPSTRLCFRGLSGTEPALEHLQKGSHFTWYTSHWIPDNAHPLSSNMRLCWCSARNNQYCTNKCYTNSRISPKYLPTVTYLFWGQGLGHWGVC